MFSHPKEETYFPIWANYFSQKETIARKALSEVSKKEKYRNSEFFTNWNIFPNGLSDSAFNDTTLEISSVWATRDYTDYENQEALKDFSFSEEYSFKIKNLPTFEREQLQQLRYNLIMQLTILDIWYIESVISNYDEYVSYRKNERSRLRESFWHERMVSEEYEEPTPTKQDFKDLIHNMKDIVENKEIIKVKIMDDSLWNSLHFVNWNTFWYNEWSISMNEFQSFLKGNLYSYEEYESFNDWLTLLSIIGFYNFSGKKESDEPLEDDPLKWPDFLPGTTCIQISKKDDFFPILLTADKIIKDQYGIDFKLSNKYFKTTRIMN